MQQITIGTANWDLYADNQGRVFAIAKTGSGASSCYFGDRVHIRRLINRGIFDHIFTEYGLQFMQGLYSRVVTDSKGNTFGLLSFDKG